MADSRMPKDAEDLIPFCKDQGLPNLCGAGARGVSIQVAEFEMASAPDDFVFADNGLLDMADGTYHVILHNQTDVADDALISAKTALQFTITGQDTADVVTLLIVGRLKGQLA